MPEPAFSKDLVVGAPDRQKPLALVLEEDSVSRAGLESALAKSGFEPLSPETVDQLLQADPTALDSVALVVVSPSFSPAPESLARALALFPLVPLVEIGHPGGPSVEDKKAGLLVFARLERPVSPGGLAAVLDDCAAFTALRHEVLQRDLFKNQTQFLEEPVARIIHDLNNQITGLKGGIDLLNYSLEMMRDLENQTKFRRYMDQFIQPSMAQIEQLVRNWRRLRENRLHSAVSTDLGEVVRQSILLAMSPPFRLRVTVRSRGEVVPAGGEPPREAGEGGPEPVLAVVNGDHLAIALAQILRNALEAVENAPDGCIQIEIDETAEHMCRIDISDNGPGIPEESRPLIWKSFYSTKGKDRNGFGLSIAKQIVDKYQGQIECVPSLLGGAAIRILLPAAGEPETDDPECAGL